MDMWEQTLYTLITLAHISCWRPFTIELKDITFKILHPEIVDFNVTIKNRTFFDVHINFVRDIPQPLIDLTVLHDSGNGNYDMVYTNKTVDVCMFLINKKSNIFFDIVYKIMSDYVDMPKKCPLRKQRFDLRNAYIDPEKFPSFMPDHTARVLILGWHKQNGVKKLLQETSFSLVIERSYKINGKAQRPFIVEVRNESYELFHPDIIDFNVTIKNKNVMEIHLNILRDIQQMFVNFELLHDSKDGTYDMVYTNKTIDVCMFLNNRKLNIFFDIFYKMLSDYGELPQKCPLRKKRYDLLNFFIDPEKFPPFMIDQYSKSFNHFLGQNKWQKEYFDAMWCQCSNRKIFSKRWKQIKIIAPYIMLDLFEVAGQYI